METVQDRVGMLRNCDTFEQNSIVKFDKNVGYNVAILAGTSYQFINMETTLRLGMLRDISAWLIGFETFVERNVCIIYVIKLVSLVPTHHHGTTTSSFIISCRDALRWHLFRTHSSFILIGRNVTRRRKLTF